MIDWNKPLVVSSSTFQVLFHREVANYRKDGDPTHYIEWKNQTGMVFHALVRHDGVLIATGHMGADRSSTPFVKNAPPPKRYLAFFRSKARPEEGWMVVGSGMAPSILLQAEVDLKKNSSYHEYKFVELEEGE